MSAPRYVPTSPTLPVRSYTSPPRRPSSWLADRPGELPGLQPEGERLGTPGPDQGYALRLARRFEGALTLLDGEHEEDALAGATAIATKRSGLLGRAPIIHDVRVGLVIWGFLDDEVSADLAAIRPSWFDEVHLPHNYSDLRRIADAAPEDVLVVPHDEIHQRHRADWRTCLDLDV
ncbi:MAG: hypothetical protein ACKO5A_08345 [Actinomycetota bacterium]